MFICYRIFITEAMAHKKSVSEHFRNSAAKGVDEIIENNLKMHVCLDLIGNV